MAPRAMWKGQLRLSLVSFGVRLYSATESAGRVSMNQLHKDCHQRLKQQMVCPVHGPVGRDEIVKGFEYEKDTYVIIDQEDLEALKLESTKVIELVRFVDADEIDPMLVDSPYFLGPDGPVAEDAFSVIRAALERTGKAGIGTLVMQNRERIVALLPEGKGFVLTTLRYAGEVRSSSAIFEDVKSVEPDEEQVALAESIIASKSGPFEPGSFEDGYKSAFFEMVKAKAKGQTPVVVETEDVPASFNFMEALKRSVEEVEGGGASGVAKKKTKKKAKTPSKKQAKKPAAKSVAKKKAGKKTKRA